MSIGCDNKNVTCAGVHCFVFSITVMFFVIGGLTIDGSLYTQKECVCDRIDQWLASSPRCENLDFLNQAINPSNESLSNIIAKAVCIIDGVEANPSISLETNCIHRYDLVTVDDIFIYTTPAGCNISLDINQFLSIDEFVPNGTKAIGTTLIIVAVLMCCFQLCAVMILQYVHSRKQ